MTKRNEPMTDCSSPASLDEAVRLVDQMTCEGCQENLPMSRNGRMHCDDDCLHASTGLECTAKGRAIIAALAEKGLLR